MDDMAVQVKYDPRIAPESKTATVEHKLNWEPGEQWGKGALFGNEYDPDDYELHTWPVDSENDGEPWHADYFRKEFGRDNIPSFRFAISPEGWLDAHEGPERNIIERIDPRIKQMKKWNFSKVANSTGTWHYNRWTGEKCVCPWNGKHRLLRRLAGKKMDFIQNAPDKALNTPEGLAFKQHLREHLAEEHEDLAPYLAHRFKRGDIRLGLPGGSHENEDGTTHEGPGPRSLEFWQHPTSREEFGEGGDYGSARYWNPLHLHNISNWHDWLQAKNHPMRKGVNILDNDMTPYKLDETAREFAAQKRREEEAEHLKHYGAVVHKFEPHAEGPTGDIDWDGVWADRGDDIDDETGRGTFSRERFHSLKALEDQLKEGTTYDNPSQYIRGDMDQLERLRAEHPVEQLPRKAGWHIKQLRDGEDAEAEGTMMNHCIGSSEQPYKNCIDAGLTTAYSLRDPKGMPHATWTYNSDDSLAELYGHSDGNVKPEYQDMIDEWGKGVGKPTDPNRAVGQQEENPEGADREVEQVLLPAAEDVQNYIYLNHPDNQWDAAREYAEDENIGENTNIEGEEPDWDRVATDYLSQGEGDAKGIGPYHPYHPDAINKEREKFFETLNENGWAQHADAIQRALKMHMAEEYPNYPNVEPDEKFGQIEPHEVNNLRRWHEWYNSPTNGRYDATRPGAQQRMWTFPKSESAEQWHIKPQVHPEQMELEQANQYQVPPNPYTPGAPNQEMRYRGSWSFGKVAAAVIEHDFDPMEWWDHEYPLTGDEHIQEYKQRRPLFFHRPTRTFHVGPPGATHEALANAAGLDPDDYTTKHSGWIGPNPEYLPPEGIEDAAPNHVTWSEKEPDALAKRHLREQLGVESGPKWNFSKVAHRLGWDTDYAEVNRGVHPEDVEQGWGKGFIGPNGEIHTWNADGRDGTPTHSEYAKSVGISQQQIGGPFEIDPTGGVETLWGPPQDYPEIFAADKRFTRGAYDSEGNKYRWNFSKVAAVRIVDPKGDYGNNPFIYHEPSNTIHFAENGGSHEELEARGVPSGHHGRFGYYSDGEPCIEWYGDELPDNVMEVHKALGASPVDDHDYRWNFSKVAVDSPQGFDYMYHVAPEEAREKIMAEGLRGHERGQDKSINTPHEYGQDWKMPAGNYLFPDYENAAQYSESHEIRDIYRVDARGLPLFPDTESGSTTHPTDLGIVHDPISEEGNPHAKGLTIEDEMEHLPARYVIPAHIPPHRLHFIPEEEHEQYMRNEDPSMVPEVWDMLPYTERPMPGHEASIRTAHVLNWSLGQWGKGLVHQDEVHTWPTNSYDGYPTHPQYAADHLGMPDEWSWHDGPSWVTSPTWNTAFQIDPEGKVRLYHPDPELPIDPHLPEKIRQADPRLDIEGRGDTKWNFAASVHKTADKLHDFLMNPKSRPDLQTPEGQNWLHHLDTFHNDKTDALMPWLTREWKKGRVLDAGRNALTYEYNMPPRPPDYSTEENEKGATIINRNNLNHWADFLQSKHPLRRELGDIMDHHVSDFHDKIRQWTEAMKQERLDQAAVGGEVVHQHPDGWSIRRLTTPEELESEGDAMGHCFIAGTLVRTDQGFKPIEDIEVGTMVLSDDGTYRTVTRIFERLPNSSLYNIKLPTNSAPITVTSEHPFLTEGGWQQAEDLREGDGIRVAVLTDLRTPNTITIPERYHGRSKYGSRKGPTAFELTDEFLWLVGLYLAEGSADGNKVQYSLCADEDRYAKRIERFFGRWFRICRNERGPDYGGLVLRFNSRILAEWWPNWLGHGCQNKAIPAELMDMEDAQVSALLRGILDGDGSRHEDTLRQTSPVLAQQIVELSLRLGGSPYMSVQHQKDRRPCFTVYGASAPRQDLKRRYRNGFARIEGIEPTVYRGLVYNLEVEGRNTFSVNSIVVHNCVGSYSGPVGRGETMIYSLRDPEGKPHVTTEIEPGHFETDEGERNSKPWDDDTAVREARPHGGKVVQIQGKEDRDSEIKPEYKQHMRDWFESFPESERPQFGDDEDLSVPDDITDEHLHSGGVDEYGLLKPKANVEWDSMMDEMVSPRRYQMRGDTWAPQIYDLAKARGEIPEMAGAWERYNGKQRDSFNDLVDQNHQYMYENTGPHPEMDPEAYADDVAEHNFGERPNMKDPKVMQEATEEHERREQEAYRELEESHGGMMAANEMGDLLAPHRAEWHGKEGPIATEYRNEPFADPNEQNTQGAQEREEWKVNR